MDDNFYIPDLFGFSDAYTGPSQSSSFPSLEGISQQDQARDPQDWSSFTDDGTLHHPFPAPLQTDNPMAAPQGVGGLG
jgi:hypothetical protein